MVRVGRMQVVENLPSEFADDTTKIRKSLQIILDDIKNANNIKNKLNRSKLAFLEYQKRWGMQPFAQPSIKSFKKEILRLESLSAKVLRGSKIGGIRPYILEILDLKNTIGSIKVYKTKKMNVIIKKPIKVVLKGEFFRVRFRDPFKFKKGSFYTLDEKDSDYIPEGVRVIVARTREANNEYVQAILIPKFRSNKERAEKRAIRILIDLQIKSSRRLK